VGWRGFLQNDTMGCRGQRTTNGSSAGAGKQDIGVECGARAAVAFRFPCLVRGQGLVARGLTVGRARGEGQAIKCGDMRCAAALSAPAAMSAACVLLRLLLPCLPLPSTEHTQPTVKGARWRQRPLCMFQRARAVHNAVESRSFDGARARRDTASGSAAAAMDVLRKTNFGTSLQRP
jgi:hypothetical protein